MELHEIILLSLLGVFILLVAIIIIRALLFNDKNIYNRETDFEYEEDYDYCSYGERNAHACTDDGEEQ